MKNEIRYFKIGLFVIISTTLLTAAILFFGAAKYLEPKIYVESYFNESIQGLDIGSPVKYRGITIGHVSNITMLSNVYTAEQIKDKIHYNRDIYIEMAITANKVKHFDGSSDERDLVKLVQQGLRVRLASQGFTGTSYLEITFVNEKDNKITKINWAPIHLFLPSAPSNYTQFTEALSNILNSLEKVDFAKVLSDVDMLATTTQDAILQTNFPALSEKFQSTLDNFSTTSNSFKEASDQLSDIINKTKMKDTLINLNEVSQNLKGVTTEANQALIAFSDTMRNTNDMLAGYRTHFRSILDNTEAASANLKAFSSNAKEYPSQMLWGAAPPKLNPKTIQ